MTDASLVFLWSECKLAKTTPKNLIFSFFCSLPYLKLLCLSPLAEKPQGYDRFIQSEHGLCEDSTCLSMIPDNLCTHLHSDHNYYAICTNLLDPQIDNSIMPGGQCLFKLLVPVEVMGIYRPNKKN